MDDLPFNPAQTHRISRRVIFGSRRARALRVGVGAAFGALTLWLILPVIAGEQAPPKPVGLLVSTDTARNSSVPLWQYPDGVLYLTVTANGCKNPVLLDGRYVISTNLWYGVEKREKQALPEQAAVTLYGARVSHAEIGLSSETNRASLVNEPTKIVGLAGKPVTVFDHPLPLIRHDLDTTAVLVATAWPQAKTALHFRIWADLIHRTGFNSCYLTLPEVLDSEAGQSVEAVMAASEESQLPQLLPGRTWVGGIELVPQTCRPAWRIALWYRARSVRAATAHPKACAMSATRKCHKERCRISTSATRRIYSHLWQPVADRRSFKQ